MLQHASLKLEFWAEAVHTAIYLINLSPSKAIKLHVPQAVWLRTQLNYNGLCIFGFEAYAHIPREKKDKASAPLEKVHLSRLWDRRQLRLLTLGPRAQKANQK